MTLTWISELMIVHIVATAHFLVERLSSIQTWNGTSNTRGPRQLVLGTILDYKNVFHLHTGEYFKVHQEDEPQNTTCKYWAVREIVWYPQ